MPDNVTPFTGGLSIALTAEDLDVIRIALDAMTADDEVDVPPWARTKALAMLQFIDQVDQIEVHIHVRAPSKYVETDYDLS